MIAHPPIVNIGVPIPPVDGRAESSVFGMLTLSALSVFTDQTVKVPSVSSVDYALSQSG